MSDIGLPKGMTRDQAYIAGVADGEKIAAQEREVPVVYVSASGGVTQYTGVERGEAVILNIDWDETDVGETSNPVASMEYIEERLDEFQPYGDLPTIREAIKELRIALRDAFDRLDPDYRKIFAEELTELEAEFEANGGRGVEDAERIDYLRWLVRGEEPPEID